MLQRTAWRFLWSPAEAPVGTGSNISSLHGKRILVLGRNRILVDAMVTTLRRRGAACEGVGYKGSESESAISAAVQSLLSIDGIIDLNLCGEPADGADHYETAIIQTITAVKTCYESWLGETDAKRIFYVAVTQMGGLMGYGGNNPSPLGGIWAGFAKTLPQELPNCNVRIIDLAEQSADSAADLVCNELYNWGLFEIGWLNGKRYTLIARRQETAHADFQLQRGDNILLSGGGRGIGFELARYLSEAHGCRVIVTGREPLSALAADPIQFDNNSWRNYERALLVQAAAEGTITAAQKEIQKGRQLRELRTNLELARARNLDLTYQQCDVTDRHQVFELVRRPGLRYKAVIHNAGVSAPVRLSAKSRESFLQTLRTKITGFFNLCQASEGALDGVFCNAGSLTGRWGGMPGETDYAAANEALSRCAMWASDRFGFPVKTICWPTWNRVGMIKNFEIASSYVSALDVQEGVEHWRNELLSAGPTEVVYSGNIGGAVTPLQLRGFPPIAELPNVRVLHERLQALGDVITFAPSSTLVTQYRWKASDTPALQAFRVNDKLAVPISLLLNTASVSAQWVQPTTREKLPLHEICDLSVSLPDLAFQSDVFDFRCGMEGKWSGKDWLVNVRISHLDNGKPILEARFRYSPSPIPTQSDEIKKSGPLEPLELVAPLTWDGRLFRSVQWHKNGVARLKAQLPDWRESDLWASPLSPHAHLPISALEALWQAATANSTALPVQLKARSILLFESAPPAYVLYPNNSNEWQAMDGDGNLRFRATGVEAHV